MAAPTEPENFLAVLEKGLRSYGLPVLDDMLKASILVDFGYVDGKALAKARRNADSTPVLPDLLCDVLALEVGLQSLMWPAPTRKPSTWKPPTSCTAIRHSTTWSSPTARAPECARP